MKRALRFYGRYVVAIVFFAIAAAAVGVYLLVRYYRKLRERELRTGAPVPVSVLQVPAADNGAAGREEVKTRAGGQDVPLA